MLSGPHRTLFFQTAILAAFSFGLFLFRLLAHPESSACDNLVFGADTREILIGMSTETIGFDAFKRPLFSVLVGLPVILLRDVFGASPTIAVKVSLALWASIATALLYLLIRRNFAETPVAVLCTLGFVLSFAPVTILSIPETYGVTTAAFLVALIMILELNRRSTLDQRVVSVSIGLVCGLAAFIYPVVMATLVVWAWLCLRKCGLRHSIVYVSSALLIALITYYSGLFLAFGPTLLAEQGSYFDRYVDTTKFIDEQSGRSIMAVLFLMAHVSPVDTIQATYDVWDLSGYKGSPLAALALGLLATLYAAAARNLKGTSTNNPAVVALVLLLVVLVVFYWIFNPREAMLYAVLPVFVTWVLLSAALPRGRYVLATLGLYVAAIVFVNLAPLGRLPDCLAFGGP